VKVGLYARVSTVDKNQDPELQLSKLREYAKGHGWEIADEYVDFASGAKWDRPQLQRIMEDARKRKIDVILVTRIDRFSRSVINLEKSLEILNQHKVAFVCTEQQIDTSSPGGNLLFHILAAIAEFERDLIRERVKEGMEKARREGKKIGRPKIETPSEVFLKARQESDGTIRGIRDSLEKQGVRVSVGTIHRMIKEIKQNSPIHNTANAIQDTNGSKLNQ